MMTCSSLTLKRRRNSSSIQINRIVITSDMTWTCKAKPVNRKFSKFKDEKLMFDRNQEFFKFNLKN
jgi:hypothetical protein